MAKASITPFTPFHHQIWNMLKPLLSQLHGSPWVVGVSGGVDSVVLAKILWDLRPLHRQHLYFRTADHGFRDFSYERALLERFCEIRLIMPMDSSEHEMRKTRYEYLHEPIDGKKPIVFTAHHLDDVVETVLIKVIRGAGILSLPSLSLWSPELARVRLFRNVKKDFLLSWAKEQKLEWVEDPTNREDKYLRNRLRKLLPIVRSLGVEVRILELVNQLEEIIAELPADSAAHKKREYVRAASQLGKERSAGFVRATFKA